MAAERTTTHAAASATTSNGQAPCPCGRTARRGKREQPLALQDCCGPYLAAGPVGQPAPAAPDAEHLMRSRYTAFVLRQRDYLLATWHPTTRPGTLELEDGVQWLGLQVRSHLPGDGTHSEVEFIARYRDATGRAHRLHERSRFIHEHGQWWYVDGTHHGE